ncbi:hypothetical protein [Streptomyces sp. NPDC002187]|uniref:hypothetical protein n=1 Tax=Streptomyces sp. NPDC002187 TaxID=3364637 RepID=UPI0036827998
MCAALLTAAAAGPLAGCGDEGGLKSAGATPTAIGPVRLWPGLPPVTAPPFDYGESDTESIPGITVPDGDVRALDPVTVVRKDAAAHPDQLTGPVKIYEKTVEQLGQCRRKPAACPVLQPYYRDLTGDGRDELIVGLRMPEQQTAVRCYMPDRGGLTRIMATSDQLVSVELAGRDVIMRSVSAGIPGYEYRTAWSWDERQRAMLPTRDEIVRVATRRTPAPDTAPPGPSDSPAAQGPAAVYDPGAAPGPRAGAGGGPAGGTP